jgi:hypothetical protein
MREDGRADGFPFHPHRAQSRLQPGEPLHPIDRVLIEVICERAHCVIYEYAILTVKMIADEFRDRVKVKPVVRRGSKKNVDRYLELCRRNGRHLSVPTVLIDGDVAFTYVPEPKELRQAIAQAIERHTAGSEASPSG